MESDEMVLSGELTPSWMRFVMNAGRLQTDYSFVWLERRYFTYVEYSCVYSWWYCVPFLFSFFIFI